MERLGHLKEGPVNRTRDLLVRSIAPQLPMLTHTQLLLLLLILLALLILSLLPLPFKLDYHF
jgi:hypothetical protein